MKSRILPNALLSLALLLLLPAAARATADTTPPTLVSIAFAPSSVDVSASAQPFNVTAFATDDSSGLQAIDCSFFSPSGKQSVYVYLNRYSDLVGGNPLNCEFSGTGTFGTCAEAGTWTLKYINVTDACGNESFYTATGGGSNLAFPPGTQTTITVTNSNPAPPASAAPVITSFTFTPTTVDLSATASVTGTATITGSNISNGYFSFISPSGTHYASGSFYAQSQLPAGTTGTFTSTFQFTSCDPGGTWKIDYLSVTSPEYNGCSTSSTDYSASQLPPGTPVSTIIVTNTGADTTPPVLTGLVLSATTLDVTAGEASLSGTVTATDDASGVQDGYGEYTSTSGQTLEFDFYADSPSTNGTFTGEIDAGSCTPAGVYTLKSYTLVDACDNDSSYGGSNQAFPQGILPSSILVINGTSPTASLTVNFLPEQASYQYPSWYIDSGSGSPNYPGETITGLSPGQHTVTFGDANGYNTPPMQTLTLSANQNAYTTGTYVLTTPSDSIETVLLPPAISGSAFWDVDYGPLQPSAATVYTLADGTPLTDGTHVISFTGLSGYVPPDTQLLVTSGTPTASTTGTYTLIPGKGALKVTIAPPGAITAGGQWEVDGGSPENSGATVTGLYATSHTVTFIGGGTAYSPAGDQSVQIVVGGTTSVTGTFTPLSTGTGSVTVTISPSTLAGAAWYLDSDSGATQKGGATLTGVSEGSHTVNFAMVNGYVTPSGQPINIIPDETVTAAGTYTKAPPFVGFKQTFYGVSPNGNSLLTVTLQDNGKFTGKLEKTGGTADSISGVFNSTGFFSGQTGKPPTTYVLQITGTSPSTYLLTGSSNGKVITAYPAAYATGQTVAELGKYTILLSNTDTDPGIPQGTGYATLTITKTGAGTATGKLADGTSFSASSLLVAGTSGHQLYLYDSKLYSKQGLLSGVLNFNVPAAGQLGGMLTWEKQGQKGSYYAAGFDTSLTANGALYVYDKAMPVPFTSGSLTLSAGALPETLVQPFTVSAKGAVTITQPNPNDFKLTIKGSTGAVTGSFKLIDPVTMKPSKAISFNGLLLQAPGDPHAAGYFLSPAVSGTGYSGNMTLP